MARSSGSVAAQPGRRATVVPAGPETVSCRRRTRRSRRARRRSGRPAGTGSPRPARAAAPAARSAAPPPSMPPCSSSAYQPSTRLRPRVIGDVGAHLAVARRRCRRARPSEIGPCSASSGLALLAALPGPPGEQRQHALLVRAEVVGGDAAARREQGAATASAPVAEILGWSSATVTVERSRRCPAGTSRRSRPGRPLPAGAVGVGSGLPATSAGTARAPAASRR